MSGGRGRLDNLVLSIFPGIDLLGRAFEEEGFCVVRGPDVLWGGDIRGFHPPAGVFTGVIGGPPCKGDSLLAHLNLGPDIGLFAEFERIVGITRPAWWIMEAVREHPELGGHILCLSPRWLGEKQSRRRYFHSNLNLEPFIEVVCFENPEKKYAVRAANRASGIGTIRRRMASYHLKEMCELQGLPADFDLPGFTMQAKYEVIGNAVPLSMGRAIAKAIKKITGGNNENKDG